MVAIVLWKDAMDFGKIMRGGGAAGQTTLVQEVIVQNVDTQSDKSRTKNLFLRNFKQQQSNL